ncbi:MAG: hypothetical protein JWQ09_2557 [Segetibacter sp.]|nr:hypothetical protein [Segetibacter sp.]
MLKCYIIDDELHAINILKSFILDNPALELAGFSQNPLEALNAIMNSTICVDILFLDINMPKISGIEVAKLVQRFTNVIITTAFSNYGQQAFEVDAYDYLLKPISYEKFLYSISKVKRIIDIKKEKNEHELSFFYVKSDIKGKLVKINVLDILFIEAALNYVIIKINNKTKQQITYLTMNEMLETLPSNFYRIHKSFIVNMNKIDSISGNTLYLEDGSVLTVGASYKELLFNALNEKVVKTKRF